MLKNSKPKNINFMLVSTLIFALSCQTKAPLNHDESEMANLPEIFTSRKRWPDSQKPDAINSLNPSSSFWFHEDFLLGEIKALKNEINKKNSNRSIQLRTAISLGKKALENKAGSKALEIYEICLTLDVDNIKCHWEKGWALYLLHEYQKAQQEWQWVLRHDPKHPNLGKSLEKINMHVLTMLKAKKLKDLAPDSFLSNQTLLPDHYTKLHAVGDTMIGTDFPNEYLLPPKTESIFSLVQNTLNDSDLIFMNHEGTLCDGGNSIKCEGSAEGSCFAFRTPSKLGSYFTDAGFNLASIANNHIMDFGDFCRTQTEQNLDQLGIFWSGRLGTVKRFKQKSKKFSLVSFHSAVHTNNTLDLTTAAKLIKNEKDSGYIVIVSFHGGAEGLNALHVPRKPEVFFGENRGDVYAFAHTVVDAGADLVLGSGPHVSRGLEIYKNKLIAYSLGNFATYRTFNLMGFAGLGSILEVELNQNGNFAAGRIIPTRQIEFGVPFLDPQKISIDLIRYLSSEDFPESKLAVAKDGTLGTVNQ